jgi:hypothetical protein
VGTVEAAWDEKVELSTADVAVGVVDAWVRPADPLSDKGEISELIAAVPLAELLLGKADVAPVGTPVMPWASLLCACDELPSDEGAEPLGAVAVPEAGSMPSVPGFIVGNVDGFVLLVTGVVGLAETSPVPLLKLIDEEVCVDERGAEWVVLLASGPIVR